MSVLKVAKKNLGKDQAGQERCCSKGVATVDSQKDEGIIAVKGTKKISRTGEVALVGDLPWMLSRSCPEEVKKGTGSSAWCTVCSLHSGHREPLCPLGVGPAVPPLPFLCCHRCGLHRCPREGAVGTELSAEGPSAGRGGTYSSSCVLRAALSLLHIVFAT